MKEYMFLFFPMFFIGLWLLVSFVLSLMGWSSLARHYKTDNVFYGRNIGICSGYINSVKYKNVLVVKYNEQGIHLSVIFIFRFCHPAVFIPWDEIKKVYDDHSFFLRYKKMVIGAPQIATITLRSHTFERIAQRS